MPTTHAPCENILVLKEKGTPLEAWRLKGASFSSFFVPQVRITAQNFSPTGIYVYEELLE
jgi:hypothetical protein